MFFCNDLCRQFNTGTSIKLRETILFSFYSCAMDVYGGVSKRIVRKLVCVRQWSFFNNSFLKMSFLSQIVAPNVPKMRSSHFHMLILCSLISETPTCTWWSLVYGLFSHDCPFRNTFPWMLYRSHGQERILIHFCR